VDFELLHSEAFRSLSYAPSIKALFWSLEKRKLEKTKRRGRNRFIEIDDPFSFTYGEAIRRGITNKQFSRAIKELIERGFWDLTKAGSGLQGDYSLYKHSKRWMKYGNLGFQSETMPPKFNYGYIGRPKERQKQRAKSAVDQRPMSAVENIPQRALSAVENPTS
jgi:hypothetical protein